MFVVIINFPAIKEGQDNSIPNDGELLLFERNRIRFFAVGKWLTARK